MQNNISRHYWPPLYHYDPQTGAWSQSNEYTPNSSSPLFIWPENSKLSAAAAEFIPQRQPSDIISSSSLNAEASEFIPKRQRNTFDSVNFSQREKLIREINAGELECLVCLEKIQPYNAIWSCKTCFHIIHLNCIVKWAKSSNSGAGWRCCACQSISKSLPGIYFCFCGKTMDPKYNRFDVAHSCGDVCGRVNRENCPHPCTQLCHPGPCPPCQILRKCHCGKTTKLFQCNEKLDLKCGLPCNKALNCGVHICKILCHLGNCGICAKEIEQTCYCKKEKRIVPCTKENKALGAFRCTQVCGKRLECDDHNCRDLCHEGDCADCDIQPNSLCTII